MATLRRVNVEIDEIMRHPVMTAQPHQTIGHVRGVMAKHKVSAMPVVNTDEEPVGIVTATDLLDDHPEGAPINGIMSEPVYTVARYDGPHIAARVMRNHHLHHVVVTEHKRVVGIVSAYDLLRLVEDHRFTAKRGPTQSKKGNRKR
jgi:CBS domain-containing protein